MFKIRTNRRYPSRIKVAIWHKAIAYWQFTKRSSPKDRHRQTHPKPRHIPVPSRHKTPILMLKEGINMASGLAQVNDCLTPRVSCLSTLQSHTQCWHHGGIFPCVCLMRGAWGNVTYYFHDSFFLHATSPWRAGHSQARRFPFSLDVIPDKRNDQAGSRYIWEHRQVKKMGL